MTLDEVVNHECLTSRRLGIKCEIDDCGDPAEFMIVVDENIAGTFPYYLCNQHFTQYVAKKSAERRPKAPASFSI